MRVLVAAHRLELGGTQTNAVDLAAALRDRYGHRVLVTAEPGPALALVRRAGLDYVPAPRAERHPSVRTARALRDLIEAFGIDVVHAWDWPQCLDAQLAVLLGGRRATGDRAGVGIVCSSMSMSVPRLLPRTVPSTFGCPAHVRAARRQGRDATLLEPPVDVAHNRSEAVPAEARAAFRRARVACATDPTAHDRPVELVIVSRLVDDLKLEGIERAMTAVATLGVTDPVRLTVVGEGPAAAHLHRLAASCNERAGRTVVVLVGALADPRPAYAEADIVLGQGGSALRALAFGRPLVVLGEQGFAQVLTPDTVEQFLREGFYGRGTGDPAGVDAALLADLAGLVRDPQRRRELGRFGRGVVVGRFGLEVAAARLDALLRRAVADQPPRRALLVDAARAVAVRVGGAVTPDAVKLWRAGAGAAA